MGETLTGFLGFLGDLWARMVGFAPDFLAGLLILVVGWLLSKLIGLVFGRVAGRLGLANMLDRAGVLNGMRQAGINRDPAEMLSQFIFWIIFLNFLLAALERIGLSVATEPLQRLIGFLPTLLAALITLVAGALAVQFVARMVQATMAGMGIEFHETLGNAVRVLLLGVVFIIVLEQIGLDVTLLNEIFVILLGLSFAGIALAFGLGGREVARNALAGYYARDTFQLGDRVVVDGVEGTIEGIGTLNTEINAAEGERIIVPNRQLTETVVHLKS